MKGKCGLFFLGLQNSEYRNNMKVCVCGGVAIAINDVGDNAIDSCQEFVPFLGFSF